MGLGLLLYLHALDREKPDPGHSLIYLSGTLDS